MTLDPKTLNQLKLWPYREAQRLQKTLKGSAPKSGKVLFETGYGPSGLPHIGTFAEVARTTWVRKAYEAITGQETTLIAFSDNVDGLRQIPTNLPDREALVEHLGKPLCDIPDPFGKAESYSGFMNAKLREFLDTFGFEYTFRASHEQYRGGAFNEGLLRILDRYEKVRNIILPTLQPETRENWSPFMPRCPQCGKLNTTRVLAIHPERGEISFACDQGQVEEIVKDGITTWKGCQPCGFEGTLPVTDGHAKVGWKVDWALRWYTFGVNYEMYGKDLIDSATLSGQICRALGGTPPEGMFYEMFLDEHGAKISKSKGNGLTIEEWLTYGPLDSLATFIFKKPEEASRLYFGAIPQHVDEYLQLCARWSELTDDLQRHNSPLWFIRHHDATAQPDAIHHRAQTNYGTILNLVSALSTDDQATLWDYILRYDPQAPDERHTLDHLITKAQAYYRDFVLPKKRYKLPDPDLRPAVDALLAWLDAYQGHDGKEIQNAVYAISKDLNLDQKRFFQALYELLLGQEQGPRVGHFIQLYGPHATASLARQKLAQLEME